MASYGWHDCPIAVREQVDRLLTAFASILADDLIGVYLHGSLALGCFNPQHSDLDLLVITSTSMPLNTKRQAIELLLACSQQPRPIEISFLARDHLLPWRYPTPFDLHYSETWRDRYVEDLASGRWQAWDAHHHDPDLAAHITVLNARGICLIGAPIASVFPSVPARDYCASLAADIQDSFEWIAANPVYTILNCCRTYAYLREQHLFSKEEGGRWALQILPAALCGTVNMALAAYRSDAEQQSFEPEALSDFASYMRLALAPLWQQPGPA
jgi:predicted nucleotidyltransferase